MIGPDRYMEMCGRCDVVLAAEPTEAMADMMPCGKDRLEAALDAALARASRCLSCDKYEVHVKVSLKSLRSWLGEEEYGWHGEGKWRWAKWDIAGLFKGDDDDDGVSRRYVDGGWGKCLCGWNSQQDRAISFTFITEEGVCKREKEQAEKKAARRATAEKEFADALNRAVFAMAGLDTALGVKARTRAGHTVAVSVEHLESLCLAAKLLRFDLDMTRLDADGEGDTGYYPPFEGNPDDESFRE